MLSRIQPRLSIKGGRRPPLLNYSKNCVRSIFAMNLRFLTLVSTSATPWGSAGAGAAAGLKAGLGRLASSCRGAARSGA
jgi:hypothetical protein